MTDASEVRPLLEFLYRIFLKWIICFREIFFEWCMNAWSVTTEFQLWIKNGLFISCSIVDVVTRIISNYFLKHNFILLLINVRLYDTVFLRTYFKFSSFNLVQYSSNVSMWQKTLVEATEENCEQAIDWLQRLQSYGETATLEALQVWTSWFLSPARTNDRLFLH